MKKEFTVEPFSPEAQAEIIREELAELEMRNCPRVRQELRESFRMYAKRHKIRDWVPA